MPGYLSFSGNLITLVTIMYFTFSATIRKFSYFLHHFLLCLSLSLLLNLPLFLSSIISHFIACIFCLTLSLSFALTPFVSHIISISLFISICISLCLFCLFVCQSFFSLFLPFFLKSHDILCFFSTLLIELSYSISFFSNLILSSLLYYFCSSPSIPPLPPSSLSLS